MMGHEMEYPVTELVLGFGFLLILTIESVTISCYSKYNKEKEVPGETRRNDGKGNDAPQISTDTEDNKHKCNEFCASYQNGHVTVISIRQDANEPTEIQQTSTNKDVDAKQSDHCLSENIYGEGMSNLHSIVLLLALSIHMIFDGLSLGLLKEDNEVWSMLMALSIHKILIFFSTGITICESTTTVKFVVAMLYMSFVSPVGVGIGILLTSQSENYTITIVSAILQAVAVGTFVYVAFFEILLKEFSAGENGRIAKAISTIFGYSIFAGIKYFMPE
ncbi:zinc transporter ZIP3-like isoform X2 [Mercenaria mercenaria]|nr:zinc transporter ZIP3-like isoform X2 [Mercenaria mercenaria]